MTTLIAFALVALPIQRAPDPISVEVNGVARQAIVYKPTKESGRDAPPLVFGFHGHGGTMRNAARMFQMHELWPEAVVVYMQGLPTATRNDPRGERPGWQNNPGLYGNRDLKFFDKLLAKVKSDHKIDSKRIYAMGHSNGGRFTYVLWTERADVFAAFGPSGAHGAGLIARIQAKPAFLIAGKTDALVPFETQKSTMDQLVEKNGCNKEGKTDGFLTSYRGKANNDLSTYIIPGGHEYPRAANALMVDFFKRHSMP